MQSFVAVTDYPFPQGMRPFSLGSLLRVHQIALLQEKTRKRRQEERLRQTPTHSFLCTAAKYSAHVSSDLATPLPMAVYFIPSISAIINTAVTNTVLMYTQILKNETAVSKGMHT